MKFPANPRIGLVGSVNSSRKTLEKLLEHKMNICGVWGLDPEVAQNVSGFVDLKSYAEKANVTFNYFAKINSPDILDTIRAAKPDLLFVVGLSQLIKQELLAIPTAGCIGFHPTKLPEGRGRGAVAWIILEKARGAATFFMIDEGMDSGPVIAQEEFEVADHDYAGDVIKKIISSIDGALDKVLPELREGRLQVKEQDHTKATFLGRRKPTDGLIDWGSSSSEIYKLIRAVSSPLPGAYSYFKGKKIVINKARPEKDNKYLGIPGRVVVTESNAILVQTGEGLIWLEDISGAAMDEFAPGHDLGIIYEMELTKLKTEIEELKKIINASK